MKQKKMSINIRFTLGCVTLIIGFLAINIALFQWVEKKDVQHLFGDYSRYVLASGALSSIISGGSLIRDALVLRNISFEKCELQDHQTPRKPKPKTSQLNEKHGRRREGIAFPLIIILFLLYCTTVLSLVTYASIVYAGVGLFFDDFEEHTPPELPDKWTVLDGTWQTTLNGTIVYEQTKKNLERTISTAGNPNWTDYVFEVKVKFLFPPGTPPRTGAILFFRFQDVSNYYSLYLGEDTNELVLYRTINGVEEQVSSPININLIENQWYYVRISIEDQTINVWVDDIQYYSDQASGGTLIAGAIGIGTRKYSCHFDDVEVSPIS